MSKRVEANVQCPSCGLSKQTSLYRSLWVEYPDNLALVDALQSMQAQIQVAARLGKALTETIDVLKGFRLNAG
jgi:hypothetical protein